MNKQLPNHAASHLSPPLFLTRHEPLRDELRNLPTSRNSSYAPILILGPTGSGKRSFARVANDKAGPGRKFTEIDCLGKLPRKLLTSIIGDAYLTNIDSLDPSDSCFISNLAQSSAHTRILASVTSSGHCGQPQLNAPLNEMFRQIVTIPRLSQRQEDISLFAGRFLSPYRSIHIDNSAKLLLENESWPENVQQLREVMRTLVALCQSRGQRTINKEMVSLVLENRGKTTELVVLASKIDRNLIRKTVGKIGYKETMRMVEAIFIARTMEDSQGNISVAARALNLPFSTLSSRRRALAPELNVAQRML